MHHPSVQYLCGVIVGSVLATTLAKNRRDRSLFDDGFIFLALMAFALHSVSLLCDTFLS